MEGVEVKEMRKGLLTEVKGMVMRWLTVVVAGTGRPCLRVE